MRIFIILTILLLQTSYSQAFAASLASTWFVGAGNINTLYIDSNNSIYYGSDSPTLNKITPAQTSSTLASPSISTGFTSVGGIAVDTADNVYFSDTNTHTIQKIDALTGAITTVAGTGVLGAAVNNVQASLAQFNSPSGLAIDSFGDLYVADSGNHSVRKIDMQTGLVTILAGTGVSGYTGDYGLAANAQLSFPYGITLDSASTIYITELGNHTVRKFSEGGSISTVVGTGAAGFTGDGGSSSLAKLNAPQAVALDKSGNLLIADTGNNRIRRVTTIDGIINTIAGNGGSVSLASSTSTTVAATSTPLPSPSGIAVDNLGNMYVSDANSGNITFITPDATAALDAKNTVTCLAPMSSSLWWLFPLLIMGLTQKRLRVN